MVTILGYLCYKWTQSHPSTANQVDLKQKLGYALAKALGPVHGLFNEGPWLESLFRTFYTSWSLKFHVLALSPTAMEALLASDVFNVSTENEVYTLLCCWVFQSPYGAASEIDDFNVVRSDVTDCLPLYRHLVKFVRYHDLSAEYIVKITTGSEAIESGILPSLLRETDLQILAQPQESDQMQSRSRRDGFGWQFTSILDLADLLQFT